MLFKLYRSASITSGIFSLILFLTVGSLRAQQEICAGSSDEMRSAAFATPFEEREDHAIADFRRKNNLSLSDEELSELQCANRDDYGLQEQLLSLDMFRSLAAYLRKNTFSQQELIDDVLSNAPPKSSLPPKAALLGALEFYSHSPLRRVDVEAGLTRLNSVREIGDASSNIQAEIHFWKAEGYDAIGEYASAETEYRLAAQVPNGQILKALADFRLGEMLEREERYAEADASFAAVTRISESPLMLSALLRLGAVERSEKDYPDVCRTMDRADSLFRITKHSIRSSARDFEFTSSLIAELMREEYRASDTTAQLVSPFYLSEVDLLRGSAESGLGNYDKATEILTDGERLIDSELQHNEMPDSSAATAHPESSISEQARFVADALRFERAWSLFQREKYQEAAGAFLQLTVADKGRSNHAILKEASPGLREQGIYYDKFYDDSLLNLRSPALDHSVLSKIEIDTSDFIYNDYPERSRYYAGVALYRAGMLDEAADVLEKLVVDKTALYSDFASYQLALIRFAQHNYSAEKLLEPLSYEQSIRGGFASFLLGELAYRRSHYERAEGYFQNAFANLPPQDTAILAVAHLERGLSLIPLGNWREASSELTAYFKTSHEQIAGRTDEALFWLGKAYFRAAEFDSSRVIFSRLLSEYPKSARFGDATYAYAWSLFQSNDFHDAEPAFEKVIALDSISRYAYDALARAGDSYYAHDDLKHANKLYNLAVDRPAFNELRTTRALLMLGVTRMKLDSNRSALNEFKYLTTKFPKSDIIDLAYFNSAVAAYSLNLSDDAEATIGKLVKHYHNSAVAPRALYVAGEERVRRDNNAGALEFYQKVLKDYPRSHEASMSLFGLQDALANLNRIPEALAVADTFIQRDSANPIIPSVIIRAGQFKIKMHDNYGATANFQKFIRDYPTNLARPKAELLLAQSELASGDTTIALAQVDTVIAKYDSLDIASQAYLERARVEEKRRQVERAYIDFTKAFDDKYYSADAAPEAMFEYAGMLVAEKETDSAIVTFSAIAAKYPIEASIVAKAEIRAGELLAAKRKWDDARSAYSKVIASHKKDIFGSAAMVRLGEDYLREAKWDSASQSFIDAQDNFPLSAESKPRALLGMAKAASHLGKKALAIKNLQILLAMRGVSSEERTEADSLLHILQPVEKKKRKKGAEWQ